MKKKLLLLTFLTFTLNLTFAQTAIKQYFDGADTLGSNAIIIIPDTSSSNIWQVGPPQKTVFDSAATTPNAIVTDTIDTYPINNKSVFSFGFNHNVIQTWGILAMRWTQKLDMEFKKDGGYVEYSADTGKTWVNVLRDTNAYNFYGFDTTNIDTLSNGRIAFTGKDTTWRDVWVCYQSSFFANNDSLIFRFTFESDSVDSMRDGWMIDNMLLQRTFFHTVSTVDPDGEFLVYPTITSGIVNIASGDKSKGIQNIVLLNVQGKVLQRRNEPTTKEVLDISSLPAGNYYIHVQSEDKIEVHKVVLQH